MSVPLIIILIALGVIFAPIIVYLLTVVIASMFVSNKKEYTKDSKFNRFLLRVAVHLICFFGRIKIKVHGAENLPDGKFVFICNHRSMFDPVVKFKVFKQITPAFISKGSNFAIPFFGKVAKRCCFLEIDREDPRKAIKTINRAAGLIKDGQVSMGVYPEGTRSKDCALLPFHDGVLKIAQKANVPIAVCTIKGTEKINKRFLFRRTTVELDVLKVFSKEDVKANSTHDLAALSRQLMIDNGL